MSRKFQFSLQRILNLKGKIEDGKAMNYMKTQAEVNRQRQKLEDMAALKQMALKNAALTGGTNGTHRLLDLKRDKDYLENLNSRISEERSILKRHEKASAAALQELVQASKDKKVIEKLRERRLAEHRKHTRQAEIIADSEIAVRLKRRETEQ